jgi:hypothetical protein
MMEIIKILKRLPMNLSIKLEFKIIRRLFKTFQEGLNGFFHGREEEENY